MPRLMHDGAHFKTQLSLLNAESKLLLQQHLTTFNACRLLKERKAEDHLFGDKDRFVTAAYKKKLEEDQKWLAEEKIREARDAKQDVTKAGHMGNFYRCFALLLMSVLHIELCPRTPARPPRPPCKCLLLVMTEA